MSERQAGVETASGLARIVIEEPDGAPSFLLALTHGAGGGVDTPDLLAVRDAALRLGGVVARITQPYRVRGARAPGSVARQDAAWVEIITALRARRLAAGSQGPLPLVQGGPATGRGSPAAPPRRWTRSPSSRWPSRCVRRAGRTGRGPLSCAFRAGGCSS